MLRANELRIGNWVGYNDSDYAHNEDDIHFMGTVTEIGKICCTVFSDVTKTEIRLNYGEVVPIQLDPEILEKCGFKHYSISSGGKTRKQWKITPNDSFYLYGTDFYYAPSVMPEVEFVHQLQNLYFSITGTEIQYIP